MRIVYEQVNPPCLLFFRVLSGVFVRYDPGHPRTVSHLPLYNHYLYHHNDIDPKHSRCALAEARHTARKSLRNIRAWGPRDHRENELS